MASSRLASLPNLTSATTNTAADVANLDQKTFWVVGTFVATAQIQISPDNVHFVNTGAALTAPGSLALPATTRFARLSVNPYTSGTVESLIEGQVTFPA